MRKLIEVLNNNQDNYILPFLWLHGEEETILREQIEKIHDTGIRAICVESRPHPEFVGEKWWRDMDIIMDEARKRNMKVWVLDDAHFPTGSANGKIVKNYPDKMKQYLKVHSLDFVGPLQDASTLVKWGSPGNKLSLDGIMHAVPDEVIAVITAKRTGDNSIDPQTLVNLSSQVQDGVLYWDIPEGDWRVFVLLKTIYGGEKHTEGYLNPLVPEAVQVLIEEVYEPHFKRYKDDFGEAFAGFFSDEPRFGNMHGSDGSIGRYEMVFPWREGLDKEFTDEEFLQLTLLTPIEAEGVEHQIRYKYMDLVSRLYGEVFTGTLGIWCRNHGIEYIGHLIEDNNSHARLGYGTGHYFRGLWEQDMAGLDVVLNQIMPGMDKGTFKSMTAKGWDGEFFHYGMTKMGASLGHLDPKKHNRTMCEVYGAYGWSEGIKLMKWITDHMLVRGVTHFVPHAFTAKAFPDPDCPPHFYADGYNPQYRFMHILFNYLNRVSHLLNDGKHIASTGLLYHAEAEWLGDYMLFQKPARELMQNQIDFDVISIDLICEAVIESSQYSINGEYFKAIVIPYAESLPQKLIDKLMEFKLAGIKVFIIDALPSRNEFGAEFKENEFNDIEIVSLKNLAKTLFSNEIYDIKTSEKQPYLRSYHYQHVDSNVYMLFNEDPYKKIETNITLSTDKSVVAYNGFSNQIEAVKQTLIDGKRVVSIALEAYQSIILIESEELVPPALEYGTNKTISGNWKVSFTSSKNYPEFDSVVDLPELQDIAKLKEYETFAGTIRYEINFQLDENCPEDFALNLGRVYEVAEVWVNDQYIGSSIAPPYVFSLSKELVKGENNLIIEVTNNLGRQQQDYLSQYMVLEPVGLLGPIHLLKNER